jgi:hypothetical protein
MYEDLDQEVLVRRCCEDPDEILSESSSSDSGFVSLVYYCTLLPRN